MEGQVFTCPGCFTTIPASCIDFKTRRAVCPSCGNLVSLSRKSINTSDKVVHDIENAVRFFTSDNYDSAKRFAESALSVAVDNIPALFIITYYNAYKSEIKTRKQLEELFHHTIQDIIMDEEEAEQAKTVWLKVAPQLADYENVILNTLYSCQNDKDITTFTDAFSPYIIGKRGDIDWFDGEMEKLYKEISERGDIPKTWYALYQSIDKNPESPIATDSFHLKTSAKMFFDGYVLRIGRIFESIKNETLKAKFLGAFNKKKEFFINKL